MKYRRLGGSGLKVSEISLGGWLTFGSSLDESGVREVVAAAVDSGINLIDLADIYARGQAELTFGKALADYRRQDLVITSKAFWPMSENPNDRGLSRKHLHESVEGSLRRLGTDYLDIYFCHRFDADTPVEEVVMAMDDLVRQGKILYWGTSVWQSARIAEAVLRARALGAHQPRAEQPRYSMVDRHIETEILPTAEEHGVGLVVWSPLAQGVLTGKYSDGVPDGTRAAEIAWVRDNIADEDIEVARRIAPVAQDLGVRQSQLALAWCLRLPGIASAITGARTPGQVTENAAASDLALDADALERLEELLGNKPEPIDS